MNNIDLPQAACDTAYLIPLAAAYVRGIRPVVPLPDALAQRPFSTLTSSDMETIVAAGLAAGVRLHPFKRTRGLPRVSQVLGVVRGIQPANLLDIGSGRGAFLWPLLTALPQVSVTAVDLLPHRLQTMAAVRRGGIDALTCARMDVTRLGLPDASFEVVTMLEVLEHIPQAAQALAEAVRVAARFVILSVPAKADDNPEHIHLFTQAGLQEMFAAAGIRRLKFSFVPNHMLVVAGKSSRTDEQAAYHA